MLWRRGSCSGTSSSHQFEINSRQCSCCLVIPHRLWPVVIGQKFSYVCGSCYERYNSGQTALVPFNERAR
jgi:hypothetical protein